MYSRNLLIKARAVKASRVHLSDMLTKQQISKQDADDQNNKLYCKAGEKAAQEQTKGKAKKSESA